MPTKLITAPASEPVTLVEVKAHLRVTSTAEDTLINGLIVSARDLCEQETGRSLLPQTWELSLAAFEDEMWLEYPPVTSITSIKYTDVNGAEQTLASTDYVLDTSSESSARVVLAPDKSWPSIHEGINGVRVRYVAGYTNAAAIPQSLKQWMLLLIGHWYRNRESVNTSNITSRLDYVDGLLYGYRVWRLF